jgi:cell division transport system permease protein
MYEIREAVAAIRRAPLLSFLSAAMVALALFVVGLFAIVTYNLHQALERMEERVEVIAYVRDDIRPAEVTSAEEALLEMDEVRAVRFVSKDQALRSAQEELVEFREIFSGLEANPLPASLEVELHPGFRDPASVARVAGMAALFPFVEDVVYGRDWVDRLSLLRRIGAVATTILGAAFACVAALIIATAVRIAIFARKDEIQIMRLVGATNGFIRRPFLLEGLATGIGGGFLAFLMTYTAYAVGSRLIFPLEWLPSSWTALGVLAGGLFGVAASAFAIRRYLHAF